MTKVKITTKDREGILKIIAEYLYKKELSKDLKKLNDKKEKFIKDIREWYIAYFNIDKHLLDFAEKYNINETCNISCNTYYYGSEVNKTTNKNCYKNFDYEEIDHNCVNMTSYPIRFDLPYYNKLSFISVSEDNKVCDFFIYKKYIEYMYETFINYEKKTEETSNIFKKFKKIVTSCMYYDELQKFINFKELNTFIDKRLNKKLSTELCTINKETVDFVKNYLESIDN